MEVNSVVRLLFSWWLIFSAVFLVFISITYLTMYYLGHRQESNSLVRWLFWWWVILQGVFWGFVGIAYFTVYYFALRHVPEMKTTAIAALVFDAAIVLIGAAVIALWWKRRQLEKRA